MQYIYYHSPMSLEGLWTNWPNREVEGLMKYYVLVQWAFWLQQIIVIHIEDRRKDYWYTLTHHFLTTTLIASCYSYHHTSVGNFILIIFDIVDLFLPVSGPSPPIVSS
jgi:acyl-CoA-dependent ceramide synthase